MRVNRLKLSILSLNIISFAYVLAERPESFQIESVKSLKKIESLSFPNEISTHHPQGLVKVGEHFFLSTVDKESKRAFIFKFHINNKTIVYDAQKDITLADEQYHPGGIDYDPKSGKLITFVAQYKAASKSTLVKIDPVTLDFTEVTTLNDHIGTVFLSENGSKIIGFNWDALKAYEFENSSNQIPTSKVIAKSSDKAYQDCKIVGKDGRCGLATGLRKEGLTKNGYLCLIKCDEKGGVKEYFNIFTQKVDANGESASTFNISAKPLAQNPIEVEIIKSETMNDDKIIFYFIPYDNDESNLLIFEGLKN